MKRIQTILERMFQSEVSPLELAMVFLGVIFLRVFVEQFLARTAAVTIYEIAIEIMHNFFFFSLAFLLIWLFLSFFLKIPVIQFSGIFLWALLLIIFPPLLDMARTGGEFFWSFYVLDSPAGLFRNFLSAFGDLSPGIVYFGTKIVFFLAIGMIFFFIWARTKNLFRSFGGALGTYVILFVMGSFPAIFFFGRNLFLGLPIKTIKAFEIAQFFGSPQKIWGVAAIGIRYSFAYKLGFLYFPLLVGLLALLLFFSSKKKFLAVLKNARYPQLVYHSGLFFVGMGLSALRFQGNLDLDIFSFSAAATLLISIWLAWVASVVVNDIYDLPIDQVSNPDRPLPKNIFNLEEYKQFGAICWGLSLLGGLAAGFPFFVLLFIYQLIAWFYSAAPLRLKRFPGIATLTSSLASLLVLFSGYILVADNQSVETLSWRIILLLVTGYTLSIPIKDFKDIAGDGRYGVWTVPVLLGERRGRAAVAVGIFISYVMSVFFLNELKLFWWALVFGGATYLIVTSEKIKSRQLPGWVLGVAFFYGLILAKVVFF